MSTYMCVFLVSWLLTLVTTPVVIRLGRHLGALDRPDIRKVHSKPVARVGGLAIFLPAMVLITSVLFLHNLIGQKFRQVHMQIISILAGASLMLLVGLIDDVRRMRARVKLFCQLGAATLVCVLGTRITCITVPGLFELHLGTFSWPLTIFWIVGITNAVNLIDGLDGLAAGICALSCGVIVILSLHFNEVVMAVIMLAFLGSLLGFLFFNFNPAKIFMGDCGSLSLGFMLASSSALCAAKTQALVGLALPFLALGIPIFDTLFVIFRRYLSRRSLFAPGCEHFHHRLLALGVTHRHAVILMYVLTAIAVGLGMFMLVTRDAQTLVVFACVVVLLLVGFKITGSVKISEAVDALLKKRAISTDTKRAKEIFEKAQLHFSRARTFDQWWQSVCIAADNMKFDAVSMPVDNRDGTKRNLLWQKICDRNQSGDAIEMTVPVPDRRQAPALRLRIMVEPQGSLESTSRRLSLFARLIDEHGISSLGRPGVQPSLQTVLAATV